MAYYYTKFVYFFTVSASQLETVSAACRVLLKYLLSALQVTFSEANPNSAQIERYLNAVRVLCIGTGLLSSSEVTVLVDTMKGENLPQQPLPTGKLNMFSCFNNNTNNFNEY